MPYNPATGGENLILGFSPTAADFALVRLGTIVNDGLGHQHATLENNVDTGALITAVAATTTQTSADQVNSSGRGIKVFFNMATVGTGSVTITIQGKDPTSGTYYTILAGAAVITNVFTVYSVYPGLTAAANSVASDVLPRTWRITATANNANATTYTVSASVIE